MGHKVDLNVHTQARAYHAGFQEALGFLVTILEENEADPASLLEAIKNNAEEGTRKRLAALGL